MRAVSPFHCGTPRTVAAGKASLYLNLAAAFCLNSDTEKARKSLHQVRRKSFASSFFLSHAFGITLLPLDLTGVS